jgi:subtilisin family serine protease
MDNPPRADFKGEDKMRNRILYSFMILLLVSCGSDKTAGLSSDISRSSSSSKVSVQSILANMEKGTYKDGELLVKFKSGIVASSSLRANQAVGAQTVERYSVVPNLERVKLPQGVSVKDAITRYMSDSNVEYAEPNYIRRIARTPDDPYFSPQQWALQNTGFANGIAGDDIKAPGAWDITTGTNDDNSVVVAVLDSGIDLDHEDLAANIWHDPGETNCVDGIDNDNNGFIDDCTGWDFTSCAEFDLTSPLSTAVSALSGAGEVPPVATSATGSANLTIDFNTGAISGSVVFSGLSSNATQSQIHSGVSGVNGPVIVSLVGGAGATSGTWVIPDGTFLTTSQFTQLVANGLYIDVHSVSHSGGEIRGQIIFTGSVTCVAPKETGNYPVDVLGNGTHVSGIIGARGDNGIGTTGVMWRVKLLPLKFLNDNGVGQVSDEIDALNYVYNNVKFHGWKIKAVNASYGGAGFSASERDAIAAVGQQGVLFMAAAGDAFSNNDTDPTFPATYSNPVYGGLSNIISVAATDQQDRLAAFSGYGLHSVQVAAPGVYILSTVPGGYNFYSGTSMAAPYVSGLVGLLYSAYPNLNLQEVRQTIFKYVDHENNSANLHSLVGRVETSGRINAYRALASLSTPTNLVATALSATQISLSWTDNAVGEMGYKVERKGPSDPDFVLLASLPADSTGYTDSTVSASTTYTYRVKVTNLAPADSPSSNPASATTPASGSPPPAPVTTSSGGGGGGACSIGARQNSPTAFADTLILMAPLLLIVVLRRKR